MKNGTEHWLKNNWAPTAVFYGQHIQLVMPMA